MKKLVLLLAVVFSVSLVSCGNSAKTEEAVDSDTIAAPVVEEVVDSAAQDSAAADSAAVVETPAEVK